MPATLCQERNTRELTTTEVRDVAGGILANIGMGIAGSTMGMGGYALAGGISGQLNGSGFLKAGVAGFVTGALGFSPAAAIAGAAAAGAVGAVADKDDDS